MITLQISSVSTVNTHLTSLYKKESCRHSPINMHASLLDKILFGSRTSERWPNKACSTIASVIASAMHVHHHDALTGSEGTS